MRFFSAFTRTGIAACALLFSAVSANASTVFDFTGGAGDVYGNGSLTIPTAGGVTFWAFDQDKRNGSWGSAQSPVAHVNDGIGVWSREEEARDQGHPLAPFIDSYTSIEYLVMKLPTASLWTPIAASFEFYNNQNFTIMGYNDATGGSFLDDGIAFSAVLGAMQTIGQQPTTSSNTFEFADGIGTFEYIVFTTTTGFNDPNNDNRFFLSGFEGLSAVPVPAALPLLATALCGVGLIGWMRRRNEFV